MSLSPKKLILLGLGAILLIAIPLTVYLAQQQQETRSGAAPATNISILPATKNATVGETMSFEVVLDPSTNNICCIDPLAIKYDSTKLSTSGAGFVINPTLANAVEVSPIFGTDTISLRIQIVGATEGLRVPTTIGTLTFTANAVTGADTPTKIEFDETTAVYPGGDEDYGLNMLIAKNPALITISEGDVLSPTLSPSPTPTIAEVTPTLTPTPVATISPDPSNQIPTCSSLALDRSAVGTAPYTIVFTASGTDADGTINKVNFSFGDGIVQDVTEGSGIGTNSINAQQSHTYSSAGTYTAVASITDEVGGVSSTETCTQVITINSNIASAPTVPPVGGPADPTPTIPPSGPGEVLIGLGAIGIIFTLVGGFILLVL